jgi:CRISPR-associated protein Csb1
MNNPEFTFGGFTVPADCRRIYIIAKLEPSNGDPRIQPTGFPDVGPVCYPDPDTDPATTKGLICLVQSEPAMANLLEEVCLEDRYTGSLKADLGGLPYIRVTKNGKAGGPFVTASTIDGHRFASEYLMVKSTGTFSGKSGQKLVDYVKDRLGATDGGKRIPAANVARIFEMAMELDPLSLIHGFQISLDELKFVGLRLPRALTACILGYHCQQRPVPGVRIDPIGTGEAGQAIFQKERIVAREIEAKFSIDVGLLAGLQLASEGGVKPELKNEVKQIREARYELLVALALWKVASLLDEFRIERSLRTECKLRLKAGQEPQYTCDGVDADKTFPYVSIVNAASSNTADERPKHVLQGFVEAAKLPNTSPVILNYAG